MKKPNVSLQGIAARIGLYFLEQNKEDYNKTREFIRDLDILDIQEDGEKISISTSRPGLLIGRKGKNIDGLTELFGKKIHIIEAFSWTDMITPVDWMAELVMEQEDKAYHDFSDFLDQEVESMRERKEF